MSLTNNEQLILQNKYSNKKQWDKELSEVIKQKAKLELTRDLVSKQFELQKQNDLFALSPDGYKLLKPTWQFELDQGYMDRHRQITEIGHKLKAMQFDASLAEHSLNIEKVSKQGEDLKAQIENLDKEIAELEAKKGE